MGRKYRFSDGVTRSKRTPKKPGRHRGSRRADAVRAPLWPPL